MPYRDPASEPPFIPSPVASDSTARTFRRGGWVLVALSAGLWAAGGCATAGGDAVAEADPALIPPPTWPDGKPPMRTGHVFLLRGLINVFSQGMGSLAERLAAERLDARDCPWLHTWEVVAAIKALRDAGDAEPLVIGGHSLGADDAVKVADELARRGIGVDLLLVVDDFAAPPIPRNVRRVLYVHTRSENLMIAPPTARWPAEPVIERMRVGSAKMREVPVIGRLLAEGRHLAIDKEPQVQDRMAAEVLALCPVRPAGTPAVAWEKALATARARPAAATTTTAANPAKSVPAPAAGPPPAPSAAPRPLDPWPARPRRGIPGLFRGTDDR